ncbi:MAG: ABC transporter substrate-binding protein [Bacteroidales bacterium]|nr:ABC transporter substrate-binding protein [Candidatus Latescibacterota bacterium]
MKKEDVMKRVSLLVAVFLVLSVFNLSSILCDEAFAGPAKKYVMLYSSMKDSQLAALKEAFTSKYSDIEMDYYSAGTGKVMTKLAAEERAGNIGADVLWVGDPTNYLMFKDKGLLTPYVSPEAKTIPAGLKDPENYFCGARIITLGLVYNTLNVKGKDIPDDWDDLLSPRFKGIAVMTDPTFSGTTLYTVAALVQNPKYGWDFIKKLKANNVRIEKGSSAVVNKVGAGEYDVTIGVDYIARSKMAKGSPIGFAYTKSGISTVASPIAIMKATKNLEAAQRLYDYILSIEGQQQLVKKQVIPVRPEVQLEGALSVKDAVSRAMPVDAQDLLKNKVELLDKFNSIMKKK